MGSKNITANRNKENVPDVFVSRNETVFPMEEYLDMGKNFIYTVKTPTNRVHYL